MRNKIIAATLAATAVFAFAGPAEANEKKSKKQKQQQTVTLSAEQFQMILEMLATRPASVTAQPGEKGPTGAVGATGPKGDTGTAGAAGKPGENGKDGVNGQDGRDGVDGKDGVGFSQGAIFLVNGACPAGTTVQGPQNRWTVYANDTSGRPWTTTGSSAQLFLSACMVD